MKRRDEGMLAAIAVTVALDALLRRVPAVSRETARCEALGIAMGILHGCCGPNGDFSGEYRPPP